MHTSDLERIVLRQGAEIFALKHLVTTLAARMASASNDPDTFLLTLFDPLVSGAEAAAENGDDLLGQALLEFADSAETAVRSRLQP